MNLVIREKAGRFTLRINGKWHRKCNYREAIDILQEYKLNAHRLLYEAITSPDPVSVEYAPNCWGRRHWLVNGRPQTLAVVRYLLGEAGCSREVTAAIIRAEKAVYAVRQLIQTTKTPAV